MECDAAPSSSQARALPSSHPAQTEEEEDGWTTVRKKKWWRAVKQWKLNCLVLMWIKQWALYKNKKIQSSGVVSILKDVLTVQHYSDHSSGTRKPYRWRWRATVEVCRLGIVLIRRYTRTVLSSWAVLNPSVRKGLLSFLNTFICTNETFHKFITSDSSLWYTYLEKMQLPSWLHGDTRHCLQNPEHNGDIETLTCGGVTLGYSILYMWPWGPANPANTHNPNMPVGGTYWCYFTDG